MEQEQKAAPEKTNFRRRFTKVYPEAELLTVLVKENPKKKGSKSAARFEGYFNSATVGAALAKGVTYQDVDYDVQHGFIKVG